MRERRAARAWLAVLAGIFLTGCAYKQNAGMGTNELQKDKDTGFHIMGTGEYDSKDTAVVVKVSEEEHTITLLNRIVNKNYTLSYDGTTVITDKYGEGMSAAQLKRGDIVDVNFQHIARKCVSMQLSPASWNCDVRNGFSMNQVRRQLSFDGSVYNLADRMVLTSKGEEAELTDLNERDVLSVQGIENTIYSINVEKGHGYLRLTGEEYFIDGFIEIGKIMARRITEGMMLALPEGEYKVTLKNGRHGGVKEVSIYRDEETVLDVEDLKGEEIKTGNVFFTLTPADASVYIDGNKVDTSTYVPLEYGIHQMIVKASGYETISQYLKVGQENANLNVEMEPESGGAEQGENKEPSAEEDDTSAYDALPTEEEMLAGNSAALETAAASDGKYYVKISAPAQAEVYVDGSYVGIAPVSFAKKEGSHVISLRRNGYQTRSYTIQVDNEQKDMELSFSELVKKPEAGYGTLGGDAALWTNDILSQTLLK